MSQNVKSDNRNRVLRQLLEETDTGDTLRERSSRFTQDSPILSDVWLAFAAEPDSLDKPRNLLINPYMGQRAGLVALELRTLTQKRRRIVEDNENAEPAPVAHMPGLVATSLTFEEMLRVALPSTLWWQRTVAMVASGLNEQPADVVPMKLLKHKTKIMNWMVGDLPQTDYDYEADRARREFVRLIEVVGTILLLDQHGSRPKKDVDKDQEDDDLPPTEEERRKDRDAARAKLSVIAERRIEAFCGLYKDWTEKPSKELIWNIALNRNASLTSRDSRLSIKADAGERLFQISCAHLTWAVIDSGIDIRSPAFGDWDYRPIAKRPTKSTRRGKTKDEKRADIHQRIKESLYIDRPLGINSEDASRTLMRNEEHNEDHRGRRTRIVARYDFTDIMRLLDISVATAMRDRLRELREVMETQGTEDRKSSIRAQSEQFFWDSLNEWATKDIATRKPDGGATLTQLENRGVNGEWMARILRRLVETAYFKIGRVQRDEIAETVISDTRIAKAIETGKYVEGMIDIAFWQLYIKSVANVETQVEGLIDRLKLGLELDWSILEEFLLDMTPDTPVSSHGTQVAGILGADWRDPPPDLNRVDFEKGEYDRAVYPSESFVRRFQGVCPDIKIMDLRVSDDTGSAQEFEAIAALQFILHLNTRSTEKTIHGANISLSIPHDARNYGCGKTRICEACEQLVASGVVVVAPAGNGGTVLYETIGGAQYGGYQVGSITDPGNAEGVITVGATHAVKPHQYGVSYFSGRGPTGDGRMKPDLVAPGEKIRTAGRGQSLSIVDGTSFAAPHVSGAGALLMARYSELVGQPQRIKEVLCGTATDLGRDRNFQGAGMLDTLRALQSL